MMVENREGAKDRYSWFSEIEGAELEVWAFNTSHKHLRLSVSGLRHGYGQITFSRTGYIDCPIKMHDVKFRRAIKGEAERYQPYLLNNPLELEAKDLYIFESVEGVYAIWAGVMGFSWIGAPDIKYLELLSTPLWAGGPSLDEL